MDTTLVKTIFFGLFTMYLLYISRSSLRVAGSHGFYRFFAWEAMTVLLLVNIDYWFTDPFSLLHIISWLLLLASLLLVGSGVLMIRSKGKPTAQREDGALYTFEKTSALVTSGIYRYIRHPLYSSLLFLAWGIFLKEISWYSVGGIIFSSIFLILTAKADESECIRYFGSSYETYMLHTKKFIPFLY
jgi:protein-S-isoprenylcysteine O-methyltransferase Ste14